MFPRGFKTWCENVAVGFRRDLKLASHDPLVPLDLAKALGVRVWRANEVPGIDEASLRVLLHESSGSWSALTVSLGRERVIIVNPSHSESRSASDLSHELSHIVLGHDPARIDVSEDGLLVLQSYDRAQEDEANWLAGCLLLPRDALLRIKQELWTEREAAAQYGVSVDMLAYRLNVTGVNLQIARRGTGNRHRR